MKHASLKPLPEDCEIIQEVKTKQNVGQEQKEQLQEQKEQERQQPSLDISVLEEPNKVVQSKPITEEVEKRTIDNAEDRKREQNEIEDNIDVEKENWLITQWKLLTEVANWKKTAKDLDLDLKLAQKSNESLLKEMLGLQEDYKKVSSAAGHLQQKVHTQEEEIKELKIKIDLDVDEKEEAKIKIEKMMQELDQEGIPKCPVCDKRFPNTEILQGHIDINHEGHRHPDNNMPVKRNIVYEEMENSEQSGYGTTKDYKLVAVQCKKCDEILANNHLLRLHMRKHVRKEQEVLKCTNCDCEYKTTDEASFLNHVVDNHSTLHICQTCNNRFPSKQELVAHIVREHNFKTSNTTNVTAETVTAAPVSQQNTSQQLGPNQIKCFDCGIMLPSREDLMKHKKQHHWKTRLCKFYHGTGRGCRFPDRVCFNIHRIEEQQQGLVQGPDVLIRGQGIRRQEQEIRRQEQEIRGQGQEASWGQGQEVSWGQGQGRESLHRQDLGQGQGVVRGQEVSWARVAGGQGQVEGAWGQTYDARSSIDCRDGTNCQYFNQGTCRYRHQNIRNQTHRNQTISNQRSQNSEDEPTESSFNMQEMKATLDNLVKIVYDLKSLKDFPKVNQQKPPQ